MAVMVVWRQGALLAILLQVVGYYFVLLSGQQIRSPRNRVIAVQDIPITNFSCISRSPGYYADLETGCQVYHMCTDGGRQFSYRCPNTTLFQQRMLICAHWYQVNCSRSEQHYKANLLIGQRDKPFVDEIEDINISYNSGKGIKTLRNPDDLQRLQTRNGETLNRAQGFQNKINTPFVPAPNSQIHFSNNQQVLPAQQFNKNTNQKFNTQLSHQNTQPPFNSNGNNNNRPRFPQQTFQSTKFTTTNFVPISQQTITTPVPETHFTQGSLPTTNHFQGKFNEPNNNQTNSYNNFITRFNPDLEADINQGVVISDTQNNNPSEEIQMYTFLKRFVPDDVSTQNLNINNLNQNPAAVEINSNLFNNNNNGGTVNLEPPVQEPSLDLELPVPPTFEDSDHMESNTIELKFQDPRQVFYIPESDSQNTQLESATPITVNIHRQATQHLLHPMLFLNSFQETCIKCHPAFVVDKETCSPCVIIR